MWDYMLLKRNKIISKIKKKKGFLDIVKTVFSAVSLNKAVNHLKFPPTLLSRGWNGAFKAQVCSL